MTVAAKDDPTRAEQQKKYEAALVEARRLSQAAAEAHNKLDHAGDKAGVPLTKRYRDAVREFRTSYALLAADDRRAGRTGFGPPIHIIDLRHALANPDEAGSIADDIEKAMKGI